ncbi:hypothetical protein TNIN_269731 [Trichonephila inaurata madagascariensis]|uniref:Uncharacterized protein n=1 Tax=Trichonephila inaurata madagascariensis TaxID=2747483 RepID=A0A8X7BUR1_9ARAC|nr:hypothetical protein TNIN_269731 [Trichonephila inaurata madagascariensis]
MQCVWLIFVLLVVATSSAHKGNQDYMPKRAKRDLPYLKDLEQLLIAVEKSLENYDVTEEKHGQCQLKATCEVYKISAHGSATPEEQKFIDRVNELRKEYKDEEINREPLAKKVFEFYEKAAQNGEDQVDCDKEYPKCDDPLEAIRGKK